LQRFDIREQIFGGVRCRTSTPETSLTKSAMIGGIMNNTKQNILNNLMAFVLCSLSLGWPLTIAYGQESGKRDSKTEAPTAPEILSVQPTGMNGEPHLQPGKQVILLGVNFSPVVSKNRVSLRIVVDNPQTPPPVCEYAGEIHLTSASPERLEGVAPLAIKSDYYLIWVRVDGAGHSKPVKVWVGSQPPPQTIPIITAVETAGHARGN
jgi:hypothetical protein